MAPEPGIADIPELINDFVQAGLPVTLGTDGEPGLVSAAVGLALYRITQESLANIAKHAPVSKARVDLAISPNAATVTSRVLTTYRRDRTRTRLAQADRPGTLQRRNR
jgi:signal transduction histidine kinase